MVSNLLFGLIYYLQVEVDMGPPILNAPDVPTTLPGNKNGCAVKVPLVIQGETWLVTCVSMGNPHCVVFSKESSEVLIFVKRSCMKPWFGLYLIWV